MSKLEFTYTIPTEPADIPLSKWVQFEALASTPDIDSIFLQSKMLELFCGIPFKHINKLKQTEIDEILSHLNAVLNIKSSIRTSFVFDGLEYALIPSFDKDITTGELIDLDNYLQKKDFISLMSILYRPMTIKNGDMYQIEPYNGTHQRFKDLPFDYFTGALSFFLDLYNELSLLTQVFTKKQMEKVTQLASQHKINLPINTVDTSI